MATTATLNPTNQKEWINRHDTFKQPIDNLFDLANADTGDITADYNATTAMVQGLIADAITQQKQIRALGGGWSFSKVATTDGWLLNTKQLNMIFNMTKTAISPSYAGTKEQVIFAQCGNSVQELNSFLKSKKRSLRNCGASNGQTIVGAFSTGTHGSALDAGSTPDFIVGMHIVTGPHQHVYLERASYPVASAAFVQKIQAQLIRNDDLFNAALVSFGSFGFIHGVMIETEEIYLLEAFRQQIPMDDTLKTIMNTLKFDHANFVPHGNEVPFHFQVVVNQYDLAAGAYATIMYKRPFTKDYTPPVVDRDKAGPGDDVPAVLGKLTDLFPGLTPTMVNTLIKSNYAAYHDVLGTLGEIFTNTETRGRVLSTALGVDIKFSVQINELLIELNNTHGPFTGIFSYRYVRKTKALLGFTKFDYTCVIELDGVQSNITEDFYKVFYQALDDRNIPYTFHWGKINNLDAPGLRKMYGTAIDQWIAARNNLLPANALAVFNSKLLQDYGLDAIVPHLRPF